MGITGASAMRHVEIRESDGCACVRVDAGVRRCTDVALMDHAPRKLAWNCQREKLAVTAFTRGGAARFLGTPQRIPTAIGFHGNTKSVPLLTPNFQLGDLTNQRNQTQFSAQPTQDQPMSIWKIGNETERHASEVSHG